MLIVPLSSRSGWSNPPWLTILLILANCAVFFFFQADEDARTADLLEYYSSSGLYRMEKSLYEKFLERQGRNEDLESFRKASARGGAAAVYWTIEGDAVFSRMLRQGTVIPRGSPAYAEWRKKRARLVRLEKDVPALAYGYRPAGFRWYTPLTYMFLHGGIMHLVGNMVFLWLIGSILELACNRAAYAGGYILAGYLSALFFGLIYHDSNIPLVGASGAIAGLMGALTVIYGTGGRVRIFYSLGFIFGYARVRALYLLPVWVGNELLQQALNENSNIAYMGHVGGLVWGALLGLLHLKTAGPAEEDCGDEEEVDETASLMEEGMAKLSALELDAARSAFSAVLDREPGNIQALRHLLRTEKMAGDGESWARTALRLMNRLSSVPGGEDELVQLYREYRKNAGRGMGRELAFNMAMRFAGAGALDCASELTAVLMKGPGHRNLPALLLALARAFYRQGQDEKGLSCLEVIRRKYPQSPESEAAARIMNP